MLSTVMLGSYLFFIVLPVDSPYYLSPHLGPPLSGHFFFDLVHQMSARGGARGGAFPSAHVSGAVVVTLVAWRHQRRLAYLLAPHHRGGDVRHRVRPLPLRPRRARGSGPGGRGGDGVSIFLGRSGPETASSRRCDRPACSELSALQARAPTRSNVRSCDRVLVRSPLEDASSGSHQGIVTIGSSRRPACSAFRLPAVKPPRTPATDRSDRQTRSRRLDCRTPARHR